MTLQNKFIKTEIGGRHAWCLQRGVVSVTCVHRETEDHHPWVHGLSYAYCSVHLDRTARRRHAAALCKHPQSDCSSDKHDKLSSAVCRSTTRCYPSSKHWAASASNARGSCSALKKRLPLRSVAAWPITLTALDGVDLVLCEVQAQRLDNGLCDMRDTVCQQGQRPGPGSSTPALHHQP